MVKADQKHLEMALIIILKNPEQLLFMQFFKKSLSKEVLALALHQSAFDVGLHPDGPGCLEIP